MSLRLVDERPVGGDPHRSREAGTGATCVRVLIVGYLAVEPLDTILVRLWILVEAAKIRARSPLPRFAASYNAERKRDKKRPRLIAALFLKRPARVIVDSHGPPNRAITAEVWLRR